MKAETKFKEKVAKDLDSLGAQCWYEKIQQVGIRGTPDFVICAGGWFIGLELKSSREEWPDALQRRNLTKIAKAQGHGLVAYPENWPKIFRLIKELAGPKTRSLVSSH